MPTFPADDFFNSDMADDITLTPESKSARNIKAIWDETDLVTDFGNTSVSNSQITCDILKSDVSDLSNAELKKAVITKGSQNFTVINILPEESGIIPLELGLKYTRSYPLADDGVLITDDNGDPIRVVY